MESKPVIGVLLGDSTGSGPEIIAKMAVSGKLSESCRPIIIGDARAFALAQKVCGTNAKVQIAQDVSEARWGGDAIPLLDLRNLDCSRIAYGEPDAACGRAVGETFVKAAKMCRDGEIDAILFAPFHKKGLKLGGFNYESESKLLVNVLGVKNFVNEINILDDLWTTRVTSHIPLKDVSAALTKENIMEAARLLEESLKGAGVANPRIALAALNPHCGECGSCGREEIDVIEPAAEALRARGMNVEGPIAADTLFYRAFNGREFDGIVTMFHDQGQIALKTRGFDHGVTVLGGIPVPIATPAHGTAYDHAGRGTAYTSAAEAALSVAIRMGASRRANRKD